MNKEKQIEEMARFVCSSFHGHHDCENCSLYEERCCVSFGAAKRLYNAGYRKQSEVIRCKDCVYRERHIKDGLMIYCKLHDTSFDKNGFCSDAE